jgi:hypothetical protein
MSRRRKCSRRVETIVGSRCKAKSVTKFTNRVDVRVRDRCRENGHDEWTVSTSTIEFDQISHPVELKLTVDHTTPNHTLDITPHDTTLQ